MRSLEIHYEPHVYRQIMHWVCRKITGQTTLKEVSGFCKVLVKDNVIHVTHAFLCPQEGSAAETDIEAEALGKLEYETRDIPGDLRLWFHSHPGMKSYWSGTDKTNIEKLGGPGWMAATVFNDKWETRSAVYQTKPYVAFIDPIPTRLATFVTAEQIKAWDEEFDKNVKSKVYTMSYGDWQNSAYDGMYDGYYGGIGRTNTAHGNNGTASGTGNDGYGSALQDFKPTSDEANNQILFEMLQEEEDKLLEELDNLSKLLMEEETKLKVLIRKHGKKKVNKPKRMTQLELQEDVATKKLEAIQKRISDFMDAEMDAEAGITEADVIPEGGPDDSQGNFDYNDPDYPSFGIIDRERMI